MPSRRPSRSSSAGSTAASHGDDGIGDDGPYESDVGPLDVFSEIDSGEEWRPSDTSDTDNEGRAAAGPSRRATALFERLHATGLPSVVNQQRGDSHGLTETQRRGLALDALGSDSWRTMSQRKRQRATAHGATEGEHEVEEAELNRLVSSLGIPAVPRQSATREAIDGSALQSEMLALSGFKSQRKKTRRTTAQTALSPEVARLLSEANIAYVNIELQEAIEKLQEVIRIDPTVKSAWATLSNCFREQGDFEREVQAKTIEAILTPRATELWISLAHRHAELNRDRDAVICFERAIATSREKDRGDVLDAMWDRACLLRDLGDHKAALAAFKALLKVRPHNGEVLSQLVPLCIAAQRRMDAIHLLEASWDFNRTHFPNPTIGEGLRFSNFTGSEIATLCDLLLMNNEPLAALHVVRQGSRWLQGRGSDTFWDDVIDDDREFDETREGFDREGAVEYGRRVGMAPVYEPLDIQLRLRLGHARARMGDLQEAERHFELYLERTDPADYSEQYLDIVDLQMDLGQYTQALAILERMMELEFLVVSDIIFKYGLCKQALGDYEEAISAFQAVMEHDTSNVEVKLRLAEAYESLGRVEDAMRAVNDFISARASLRRAEEQRGEPGSGSNWDAAAGEGLHAPDEEAQGSSRNKVRKRKTLKADERERLEKAREEETTVFMNRLRTREAEVFVEGWWREDVIIGISGLDPTNEVQERYGIDAGESEEARMKRFAATRDWLDLSGRLIDSFRRIPHMFPRSRVAKERAGTGSKVEARLRDSSRRQLYRRSNRKRDVDLGAKDLMGRLQDRVMHDSVMNGDDGGIEAGDDGSPYGISGAQPLGVAMTEYHFRGMDYNTWTDMFIKHAFVLTKIGDHAAAFDLLDHILSSHLATSHDSRRMALTLCQAACGFYARQFMPSFEVLRQLISLWQFHNTPLRLVASLSHIGGFYGLDAYTNHKIQKLLVRRSRIHEVVANNGKWELGASTGRYIARERLQAPQRSLGYCKNREPFSDPKQSREGKHRGKKRKRAISGRLLESNEDDAMSGLDIDGDDDESDDDDDEEDMGEEDEDDQDAPIGLLSVGNGVEVSPREKPPTKEGIIGEIAYGYFLLVASSWQSALGIALRAYARAPKDALVCLMAAVACFGRITNRQTDNRHHLFIQGLSFLSIYRRLRTGDANSGYLAHGVRAQAWIEAEYNFGRALHQAGLLTEAMQSYERVLAAHDGRAAAGVAVRDDDQSGFDCYREAAWNLSLLYSINGNGRAARVIMAKYLRIS